MFITANYQPYQRLAKIACCMIVKNEEDYIIGCLESVISVVDEIVIVDTGSTDETIHVINTYKSVLADDKIHLYERPWEDGFAYMKNLATSLSTIDPDYFMIIDGDEILDPEYTKDGPREFRRRLNLPPAPYNKKSVFFTQRHYTNDVFTVSFERCQKDDVYGSKFVGYYDSLVARLYPNDPNIKFEGKIHEVVENTIKKHKILTNRPKKPIILHHYGNCDVARRDKKKSEFYVKLLKEQIEDYPTNWMYWLELGTEYSNGSKPKEAIDCFKKSLELKLNQDLPVSKDFTAIDYVRNIQAIKKSLAIAQVKAMDPEAETTLVNLFKETPHDPDLSVYLGMVGFNQGDFDKAEYYITQALKMQEDNFLAIYMAETLYLAKEEPAKAEVYNKKMKILTEK